MKSIADSARRSSATIVIALMAAEWILLVASAHLHEMLVGAAAVAASALFLNTVRSAETLHVELCAADLIACWRIPWYIASGAYEITLVLLKDLLRVKPAGSFYRVDGFRTDKRNPRMAARRALAVLYTTAAPNFIVIGIDPAESRMLFHQIERSSVPKMTAALGAQP